MTEIAGLNGKLSRLETLQHNFQEFFKDFVGLTSTANVEAAMSTPMSNMTLADIDERINQRLSGGPTPVPVVSVDVDARLKELVKNEVVQRIVVKIKDLPDPAKKAAYWLHEKKQTTVQTLYNYVYDKKVETGRLPGTFYLNVVNPLVDAWLISSEKGNLRWVLQERLAAELKDMLNDADLEKVPKYLVSLLL
jgi:hypothetical protein